ncbi:hypothetical protein D3C81_737540 [compost metagenome]
MVIISFTPAQDLPVEIFLPWVGAACRLAFFPAFDVVGQGAIDLAVLGADHNPFRAVHARGLELAGSQARMDQDLGLAGKTVGGNQAVLAVAQLQPLAFASRMVGVLVAIVEPRDIQGAVVEQAAVGAGVLVVDAVAADEFVDELTALIVAHVDHRPAIAGFAKGRVFVLETAQGRALDRGRVRIERIDLHHPAMTVQFVGVLRQVEARVVRVPADFLAVDRGSVAFLPGIKHMGRIAAAEAVGEVLFAGQVGAPRRLAVGAVLERAEHLATAVVGRGLHPGIARRRAADTDR